MPHDGDAFGMSWEAERKERAMTDEIRPALTPSEWESANNSNYDAWRTMEGRWALVDRYISGNITHFHAAAALCLYQQPFGFTREDAKVLARFADCRITDSIVDGSVADGDFEKLASLAARILALLPPAHQETPE